MAHIFYNNIAGTAVAIGTDTVDARPTTIKNNDFYGFNTVYKDGITGDTYVNSTDLNGNPDVPASDNIDDDPAFTNYTDYTLQASSPLNTRTGGLDLTTDGFVTDKNGANRTGDGVTGWSMGAYEQD